MASLDQNLTTRGLSPALLPLWVPKRPLLDGASRTRTGDLLGAIQALSQLSYSPAAVKV